MRAAGIALLVVLLTAPAATQNPSPASSVPAAAGAVDRALVTQFVSGAANDREALIDARPEIIGKPFRDFLITEGSRLRQAGDYDAADRYFRAAIDIGERHNFPGMVVTGLNALGQMASNLGDQDKALGLTEQALAIATASGDRASQQQTLSALGILQRRAGELEAALSTQTRALELASALGDTLAAARAQHNVALVTQMLGNSAKALELYVQSLNNKTAANAPSNDLVVTLMAIGTIYAEQNEPDIAASYYQRAIDASHGVVTANVAGAYNNLGQAQLALGDLTKAKATLEKALPLTQQSRNGSAETTVLYNLGILARMQGRFADAEALQRQALERRESARDPMGLVESLTEMSNLLVRLDRAEEALPYGERAVELAQDVRLPNQLWKAQLTTATGYSMLGRTAEAQALFEGAIHTIESLRVLAAGGNTGQRIMMGRLGPFYGLAALDLRAGKTFEALRTIDRGRARALIDVIATTAGAGHRLSDDQREGERALNETLRNLSALAETELRKAHPDPVRIAALDADVAAARSRREAFLGELYAQRPELRLARGNTADITPDQLMTLLTPGTAIVSYMLDDKAAWVLITTRGESGPTVTAHQLTLSTDDIMALADKFSAQVSSRDLGFATTARLAYDALLGPAASRIRGVTRLVIIPDGPLWRVPFQALRSPENRFVIESAAVSYTPSIAALYALEERRRARPAAAPFLLALGDPSVATRTRGEDASSALRGPSPVRLPEAAREVRALGALYGADRSRILIDAAATEGALRRESTRATVLHVATHGILDNFNPMYSHLLLAPSDAAAIADDGRLEAWELMDMTINADVAVLSACQTARGGSGFGEGIMGLSWSLFASGASTAVVSQWEVDSSSTTKLMIGFHQRLIAGGHRSAGAPAALRQSALALMKNPDYRHPFYWAGFISVGAR